MSAGKIKVPEGMIEAAQVATRESIANLGFGIPNVCEFMLEAALRWLSEELSKMKKGEPYSLTSACSESYPDYARRSGFNECIESVLKLFAAPDSVIPEEIKDLLLDGADFIHGQQHADEANKNLIEAYNRGQRSAK